MKIFARLLMALIAWGALSFGAVYPWGYWPLAVGAAALGVWAIAATHAWRETRTRNLGLSLAAIALAIGVQLIALPYGLLATLSPAVDRFLREYEVAYHPASLHPLSLDPRATAVSLAIFVGLALLAVGLVRAIRYVRLEWLLRQLMGFGVALAVLGVVQAALLDEIHPLVYGFWRPEHGGNPFGPFVNRNHFAGWMVMALPLVLGYSCALLGFRDSETRRFKDSKNPRIRESENPRIPESIDWGGWARWFTSVEASPFVLAAFVVVALGMSLVMTGSRSGLASFAVALAAFAGFLLKRPGARRARMLAATYLFVLLAGAVVWAGVDRTVDRFGRATSDVGGRLSAWTDTRRIIQDFPVFGTGVGTYGRAMLLYQTTGRDVMYAQAHNDYLQIVAEGGLLVVAPIVLTVGLVVLGVRRRFKAGDDDPLTHWTRVGAVAGLVGIATQSLVEFSLQMPGNRVLFVLLVALALHRPLGRSRDAHRV